MDDENQPLREVFDKIDANELDAMKERREEESFNLDFKRMDTSGEPSNDDKKNLREAISGFANSAGGILLWGVESKSGDDKRDRSRFHRLVPVMDGDRAAVRFHELTATATQPPVSGVVHKSIPVAGGFVVKTFVPASDGGPHRTNEEKGQYFRRDADFFRAMQHHEIADMFGRRARPRLELWWHRAPHDRWLSVTQQVQFAWVIGIRNTGRGIARFPSLSMKVRPGYVPMGIYDLDASGTTGLTRRNIAELGIQTVIFAGGGNDVIHPGQTLHLSRVGLPNNVPCCCVKYDIFAEHMQTIEGAFRFYLPGEIRHDHTDEEQWWK